MFNIAECVFAVRSSVNAHIRTLWTWQHQIQTAVETKRNQSKYARKKNPKQIRLYLFKNENKKTKNTEKNFVECRESHTVYKCCVRMSVRDVKGEKIAGVERSTGRQ